MNSVDKTPAERVTYFKNELNKELELPDNSELQVKILTRLPSYKKKQSAISHLEFEQLLRLLYACCIDSDKEVEAEHPIYSLKESVLGSDSCSTVPAEEIRIINAREFQFRAGTMKVAKLIIFSEMFFAKENPLTVEQKTFIEEQLLELTRRAPNVILCPNFLFTEQRRVSGDEVHQIVDRMNELKTKGFMLIDPVCFESFSAVMSKIPSGTALTNQTFLINESHLLCRGRILTRCRKYGYNHEADKLIGEGVLYDSGMGFDEPQGPACRLQEILLKHVSTELDLEFGESRDESEILWTKPVENSRDDTTLHILQAEHIVMGSISHAAMVHYQTWKLPFRNLNLSYWSAEGKRIKDNIRAISYKSETFLSFCDYCHVFFFMSI